MPATPTLVAIKAKVAAILDAPAQDDARTVEVVHEVIVCADGEVSTRGLNVHGQVALREADSIMDDTRAHSVRVRYRVPLPPEPVEVHAEVCESREEQR